MRPNLPKDFGRIASKTIITLLVVDDEEAQNDTWTFYCGKAFRIT